MVMSWSKLYACMTLSIQARNGYRLIPSRNIHKSFTRDVNSKIKWKNIGINGVLLLTIPLGTFCLGTWQVSRLKWKLGLIEELENLTKQPPIQFPENLEKIEKLGYRKILIEGEFDHSKELYLGPRPLMVGGDIKEIAGGMLSSGQSGYNVVTPFTLSDKKLTILVNRGWVPRNNKNPFNRIEGQTKGQVSLTGVVRPHENRPPFMPKNQFQTNIFTYRDVEKMAELTGSSPIFVDAVETFEGGPIGSQTRVTLRNEHLSYLLTWYCLSLFTSLLWYRRFILRKPLL